MKNYISIKNRMPFRSSFMYIDYRDHIADQIFIDHGLNFIYFGKKEFYNKDTDLCVVYCSIFSKDEKLFIECMEHLRRKLEFLDFDMEVYDELSEIFELINGEFNEYT